MRKQCLAELFPRCLLFCANSNLLTKLDFPHKKKCKEKKVWAISYFKVQSEWKSIGYLTNVVLAKKEDFFAKIVFVPLCQSTFYIFFSWNWLFYTSIYVPFTIFTTLRNKIDWINATVVTRTVTFRKKRIWRDIQNQIWSRALWEQNGLLIWLYLKKDFYLFKWSKSPNIFSYVRN